MKGGLRFGRLLMCGRTQVREVWQLWTEHCDTATSKCCKCVGRSRVRVVWGVQCATKVWEISGAGGVAAVGRCDMATEEGNVACTRCGTFQCATRV